MIKGHFIKLKKYNLLNIEKSTTKTIIYRTSTLIDFPK